MFHRSLAAVVLGLVAMPLLAQEVINACANPNRNNFIRLVADTSECLPFETPLTWNVEGPEGQEGPPGPPGPATAGPVEYWFVGFSTATVNGGVGLVGMHGACQADFGPEARMSTTTEMFRSPIATPQTGLAWVNQTDDLNNAGDPSRNCQGWGAATAGKYGTVVLGDVLGIWQPEDCDKLFHVACAVPVTP